MNLPAVTVGIGVVIAVEMTGEAVGICDIVVVNLLAATVVIGVLIFSEVSRELVSVCDIVVVNLPAVTVEIGDVFEVSEVIKEVIGVIPKEKQPILVISLQQSPKI